MKRYTGIYEQIYDFANLERAYKKARRCKRYRNEVLRYSRNLEENLINLQNHLIWHSYEQGIYRTFYVYEPKKRLISALPFADRVAQHAINNILEPLIDRRFYYHSYACRKEKGMHKASEVLTKWLYDETFDGKPLYAIKADIHHYFQSIDHERLKATIRRIIKDEEALALLDKIIDNVGTDGKGIPVGNLTSQLFANLYLDRMDKYLKETLHVRHYIAIWTTSLSFRPTRRICGICCRRSNSSLLRNWACFSIRKQRSLIARTALISADTDTSPTTRRCAKQAFAE